MSQSPIQAAIQQIAQEKNLSEESIVRAVEMALAAAYRKDFGNKLQNIVTEFDPKTGGVKVFDFKTVVEDLPEDFETEEVADEEPIIPAKTKNVKIEGEAPTFIAQDGEELVKKFNPKTEVQLKDAKLINKKYKVGDEIITPLEVPGEFGRMAAQTAKQVIIQKIREEERQNIYSEFKGLEFSVLNGTVQRREGRNVLIDLGHATAILPMDEQVPGERYSIGNRMKFYLKAVEQTNRGPELIVSRASTEVIRKVFELEIPEVANNLIEIKSIAREPGSRSKVAIFTSDESIDPIGSCVGQRGSRIQTIISELNGEKIDIILFDEDPVKFITNALSPAKVIAVELKGQAAESPAAENEPERIAIVKVREDQLSLAIGRSGQNVRLASRLTGWKIDIISEAGKKTETAEIKETAAEIPAGGEAIEPQAETKTDNEKESKKKSKTKKSKKEEKAEVVDAEEKTKED